MFIHLRVDDFRPDIMFRDKSKVGEHFKVRMVPATNIQFYFSLNGIPLFRQDIEVQNTNPKEDKLLRDLEVRGQTVPWKVNLLLCGPQNRIEIDMNLLESLNCLPRPKIYIPKRKRVPKAKPQWKIDRSVFKTYKNENVKLIERCFEFDWNCSKIPKIVKSEEEQEKVKKVLRKNYRLIRECYKYFAGVSPCGIIPGIGTNVFNEIVNATDICDSKKLKLADIDVEFIVTKAGVKKNPLNPERWLIRYQFMEIFLRLAIHKYYKSKIVLTQSDAISKLCEENLFPFFKTFDCNQWRLDNLWNNECEETLTKYMPILQKLYNKYSGKFSKPGKPNFMSIEEFITMINDSQVLINESAVGTGELGAQFNMAMFTQVNQVERDRHFHMMFVEFMEAVARVAFKINNFPDLKESFYTMIDEPKADENMIRNRGSSEDTSSDDDQSSKG